MKKAYEAEEKHKHFRAVACFRVNVEGNQSTERKRQSNAFHNVDIQGLLTPDGCLGVSASGNVIYPRPAMSLFFFHHSIYRAQSAISVAERQPSLVWHY
jgi:hypothetical protein